MPVFFFNSSKYAPTLAPLDVTPLLKKLWRQHFYCLRSDSRSLLARRESGGKYDLIAVQDDEGCKECTIKDFDEVIEIFNEYRKDPVLWHEQCTWPKMPPRRGLALDHWNYALLFRAMGIVLYIILAIALFMLVFSISEANDFDWFKFAFGKHSLAIDALVFGFVLLPIFPSFLLHMAVFTRVHLSCDLCGNPAATIAMSGRYIYACPACGHLHLGSHVVDDFLDPT